MDVALLKQRIEQVLALPLPEKESTSENSLKGSQIFYGAISVLEAAYGPQGTQLVVLRQQLEAAIEADKGTLYGYHCHHLALTAISALLNLKAEINSGFSGSLRQYITAEILTDFIQLARAAFDESSDGAKNVAAVLAAAAFEDTVRRMGSQFAGISGDNDLKDVIEALKKSGTLQSPQLGIALGYLSFRNHALHAKWQQIQREAVQSVLGFVEELLLKHFA